eukprot:6197672-Pleurochrysis_carterae.AAC.3
MHAPNSIHCSTHHVRARASPAISSRQHARPCSSFVEDTCSKGTRGKYKGGTSGNQESESQKEDEQQKRADVVRRMFDYAYVMICFGIW